MKRPLVMLVLLALWAFPAHAEEFRAKVIGISDGDTLTVLREKQPTKIRLHGIDAPESGQDFGSKAKQAAANLAFGREVTVHVVDQDRYGRTVADINLPDGRSLNRELVTNGMAWWYRQYTPIDRDLAKLEREAREAKRGLWSQPNPTPPWDWRRGEGANLAQEVVGNRNSRLFQPPNCPSVARMKEANKIVFKTAADAEAMGYRRAKDCRQG